MKAQLKAGSFQRLRRALDGLRAVADGEVVANVVRRFAGHIRGRVKGELARHVATGKALGTADVTTSTRSVDVRLQDYYRYIRWSWSKGVPFSVLSRGQKIVEEEMAKAMGGGS